MKEGERAQLGSTHQYINVLLLIEQRPHLLYITVEDGLDQRRLQKKKKEKQAVKVAPRGGHKREENQQCHSMSETLHQPDSATISLHEQAPRACCCQSWAQRLPCVHGSASTRDQFSSQQRYPSWLFVGEQTKESLEKLPCFLSPRSSTDYGPSSPPAEPSAACPCNGLALHTQRPSTGRQVHLLLSKALATARKSSLRAS